MNLDRAIPLIGVLAAVGGFVTSLLSGNWPAAIWACSSGLWAGTAYIAARYRY